jgi:hypothetical protein
MRRKTILAVVLYSALLVLNGCSSSETPVHKIDFQKFRFTNSAGPCAPEMDCLGVIELASNGTLSYDKFGELPVGSVHTATVTQAELDAAILVLTNSSLIDLLNTPGLICNPPTDAYESMTLSIEGASYSHETTSCDNQPISDARQTLNTLVNKYFP